MALGPMLDRMSFWNIPSFIKSYELPVPHESFLHEGLEIWRVPGKVDAPTVLFCHGNAGHLRFPNARRNRLLALHGAGVNLWAFDYRGYGRSQALTPTETRVYEDARAVHSLVRSLHDPEKPLALFGRSLGGAVATYLATEVETPDLLILESTFTSAPDVCASWTNESMAKLMTYKFHSLERIPQLRCPLFMVHGTEDRVVSYRLGRQLFEACPSAREFVSVAGAGHNNLQAVAKGLYEETLARWLAIG